MGIVECVVLLVSAALRIHGGTAYATTYNQRPTEYLVLEHGAAKGPDCSKDKVELINFLCTVWWGVFWGQQTLQQVAQHLDHALFWDGNYLLKPVKNQDIKDDMQKQDMQTIANIPVCPSKKMSQWIRLFRILHGGLPDLFRV